MKSIPIALALIGVLVTLQPTPLAAADGQPQPDTTVALQDSSVVDSSSSVLLLAGLKLTTIPPQATVVLDGTLRGLSPLELQELTPGEHTLVLQKTGHYAKKVKLVLEAGVVQELSFELLRPAGFFISSEPDKAEVILDNKVVGTTPFSTTTIKPGSYSLKIQKLPFAPLDTTLTLQGGEIDSLHVTLHHTAQYTDSVNNAAAQFNARQQKQKIIVPALCFALFAIVILFVELSD
jgi:hypothetical protein